MKLPYLPIIILIFILGGCEQFEFDPNQSVSYKSDDMIHFRQQQRLSRLPYQNKTVFAVTGDSHLDYDNLALLVESVNKDKEIKLLVHMGDITDHGLLKEFEWGNNELKKLRVPYFVTIGNHDVVAKGEEAYRNMFGPTDFSFVTDSIKFVFFNSNGREYGNNKHIPNISTLHDKLESEPGVKGILLFSHVPYWDKDFNHLLTKDYVKLLNSSHDHTPVIAAFNGHLHAGGITTPADTQIKHLLPGSVNERSYLKVTIENGVLSYEKISF
ncbi:MAG: metallophosphoesterase [Bacteroidia bacterium]|jgi:predicted phosphodiesterase|nr:metallophosphoesterase [Bacteroidia bacterium]